VTIADVNQKNGVIHVAIRACRRADVRLTGSAFTRGGPAASENFVMLTSSAPYIAFRERPAPAHSPLIVRITHWIKCRAIIIMIMSGLRFITLSDPAFKVPLHHARCWLGGATQCISPRCGRYDDGLIYVTMLYFRRFKCKLWLSLARSRGRCRGASGGLSIS